ncbi:MAG: hypothetical protein ACLR6I_19525 [Waltera sp.]
MQRAAQNGTEVLWRSAGMCLCRRWERTGLLPFSGKHRSGSAGTGEGSAHFPKTVKPRRICSSTVCMWNNTWHATYHPEDYYLEGLRRDPN